ncbi:MAG: site-specific integrase [Actinomycetota bacterium]|nr:site-specific integrase [Actinomycetota bacterium]
MVRAVHAGIRRSQGTAPAVKAPAVTAELRAMVAQLPGDLRGVRDRAMLLVGFAAALRRSELVALDVADVAETAEGLVVTLRRSKTDPEGAGRKIGVPYGSHPATCPVRALRAWTEIAGVADGPLFVTIDRAGRLGTTRASDRCVARTVQRAALGAGLDPARYAGHSLRAGLATSAAATGASERSIMNQTGHKSLPILRRYIREGSLFTDNAAASVGL